MKIKTLAFAALAFVALLASVEAKQRVVQTASGPQVVRSGRWGGGGHGGNWGNWCNRGGSNVSIGIGFGFGFPGYYGGYYGGYPGYYGGYGYPYGGGYYPYGYGYSGGYYGGGYPYGYGYNTPYYSRTSYGSGGNVVAQVQQRLARAGYYRGSIDGVMGPRTRYAIRTYESSHGLPADGQIDRRLLATLGLA